MRKVVFLTLAFFILNISVWATAQYPDKLVFKGDTISIFSNPLEEFLNINNIDSLPGLQGCMSTACWRGYIGVWIIENDSLFLTAVTPCCDWKGSQNADLSKLFGNNFKNGKVFADWVNQTLLSPQGRLLQYIHMGYGSVYERELHLTIENGIKTKERWITNSIDDPELIDRFNYDLMQDTLFHYISILNWDELGNDLMCDDFYLITINKKGKPTSVSYDWYDSKCQKFWWNLTDGKCRRKIFRSIKHLRFDQLLVHGELQKEVVKVEVFWNDETQELEHWKN
ncbi:hypothetical protein [Marinoscillum sp.]|uniref:hypothetical protein n=1 Tax=Marinoscillum sp. TaxID=2024838 RepID=UPI003BAA41BA